MVELPGTTPGPWTVHRDGSTVEYVVDAFGNRRTLCSLNWPTMGHQHLNARLIAAAPDMAELLATLLSTPQTDPGALIRAVLVKAGVLPEKRECAHVWTTPTGFDVNHRCCTLCARMELVKP
jgi:hypothetical protein